MQIINPLNDAVLILTIALVIYLTIQLFRVRRWIDEGYLLELQTKFYEEKLNEIENKK